MKIATAIGILSLLFSISSCNTTNYPNELNTIDSLMMRIDTAQKIYAEIDTAAVRHDGETFKRKFSYLSAFYQQSTDTLARETAFLLGDYQSLRKPFSRFIDQYGACGKELAFSEQQLIDLRFDLEHNLLDTNFVSRMVNSETKTVDKIVSEIKTLSLTQSKMVQKNKELEPAIDSLINTIKLKI